jgi:hypothetical protein
MHVELDRAWMPAKGRATRYLTIRLQAPRPAEDVTLTIKRSFGCNTSVLGPETYEWGANTFSVKLGTLAAGERRRLLVAVKPWGVWLPRRNKPTETSTLTMWDRTHVFHRQPLIVEWPILTAVEGATQPVNADVLLVVAEHIAAQVRHAAAYERRHNGHDRALDLIRRGFADILALHPGDRAITKVAMDLAESSRLETPPIQLRLYQRAATG